MSSSFVDGFETIDSNLTFELGNENYVDYNTITLSLSTTTSQNSTPSSKDSTNEPNKQNYSLNKSNKKLKFHNIKNSDFEDDLPNDKILSYQNSNNKKNNLKIKNFHKIDSNQNNLINKRKFDELNNSKKNKYLQSLITEQQTVFNYMSGKYELLKSYWSISRNKIVKELKVSEKRLSKVAKKVHDKNDNITPVEHSNTNKIPANKITNDEIINAKYIIDQLIVEPSPCKLVGGKYLFFTNYHSKQELFNCYKKQAYDPISYTSFLNYYHLICPNKEVRSKKYDVCNKCIELRFKLQLANDVNIRNELKNHQDEANQRRMVYEEDKKLNIDGTIKVYSFDFKSNILIPSSTYQPNLYYFKSKLNSYCFDIADELEGNHYIKIFSELTCDKTADSICTFLYQHLLSNNADHIIFWADNCAAQNKNKYVIAFIHLMVELNFCKTIRLKFMIAGHTHFSPDRSFGWISKKQNACDLFTVDDVVDLCNSSSTSISAEKYEDFYNWREYFEVNYNTVDNISKCGEFCVDHRKLGYVFQSEKLLNSTVYPEIEKYDSCLHLTHDKSGTDIELGNKEKMKLSQNKIKDLKTLIEKGLIPKNSVNFYQDLFE